MVLEPIHFLSVLSRALSNPALDEHVQSTFVDEELDVEGRVALGDSCVVEHGEAIRVPHPQVHRYLAHRAEQLHCVKLAVLNRRVERRSPFSTLLGVWVCPVGKKQLDCVILPRLACKVQRRLTVSVFDGM